MKQCYSDEHRLSSDHDPDALKVLPTFCPPTPKTHQQQRGIVKTLFSLAILLLAPTPLLAEESLFLRSGEHQGWFLRVCYGNIPTSSLEYGNEGQTREMTAGVPFRIWIGHSVAPRWIVHASVIDVMAQFTDADESASAMSWGLGVTKYTNTANIFLSGSIGFSPLVPPSGSGTLGGYRWTLAAGKEIQLSANNGLGAMLTFDGGSWKDPDTDESWSLAAPGVQLVWTFN